MWCVLLAAAAAAGMWLCVRSKNNDASDGLDGWMIAGWMDDDVSVSVSWKMVYANLDFFTKEIIEKYAVVAAKNKSGAPVNKALGP